MKINELMERWRRWQRRATSKRLDAACTVEHEYKPAGDPPRYAFVRFECVPADELSLVIAARWPATQDRSRLDDVVAAAVVDVLASGHDPHLRCAVTLVAIKFDDVGSSEHAFYRATAGAMTALRDERGWSS